MRAKRILQISSAAAAFFFALTLLFNIGETRRRFGHIPTEIFDFETVPGAVINYIESPRRLFGLPWNPVYISDPSITILPCGDYIASHALFGRGSGAERSGTTYIFRSSDRGETWNYTSTLADTLRGSLFTSKGDLYIFGYSSEGGDIIIRKSRDGGESWTTPDGPQKGLILPGHHGGTPNNPTVSEGRIWTAQGGIRVMSAPLGADLLDSGNWTKSAPASREGHPFGEKWDIWTEGQVVASPEKGVYVLPKIKNLMHTARIKVQGPSEVSFDAEAPHAFPSLPGGEKKFGAAYDRKSKKFYVLSNPVLDVHADSGPPDDLIRTASALISSQDLISWDVKKIFLYTPNIDDGTFGEGFQYFNFDFDGEDIIVASRTALKVEEGERKPPRGHDSNLLTFHRIEDFRNAAPRHMLALSKEDNQVWRFEKTRHKNAPLGRFALGKELNTPGAMGQCREGYVFISDEEQRIFKFDALGNFLDTVRSAPVQLQSGPLPIEQPREGLKAWKNVSGGDWHDLNNWYYWGRPDTCGDIARLGSAIKSDATIELNKTYAMSGLEFRNPNSYTLSGNGLIEIKAGADEKGLIRTGRGMHTINVPLSLFCDTRAVLQERSGLEISGTFKLQGNELLREGEGRLIFHSGMIMAGGRIVSDGSGPVVFSGDNRAVLDGEFKFDPCESLEFQPGAQFQLLAGAEHLDDRFESLRFPQLPEGLEWDASDIYCNGTVQVIKKD